MRGFSPTTSLARVIGLVGLALPAVDCGGDGGGPAVATGNPGLSTTTSPEPDYAADFRPPQPLPDGIYDVGYAQAACFDPQFAFARLREIRGGNCWSLTIGDKGTRAFFAAGTLPGDSTRGVIVAFKLYDIEEASFPLAAGSGEAFIYHVDLDKVCFVTADGGRGAIDLPTRRLADSATVGCGDPPRYEVGTATPADCFDAPTELAEIAEIYPHDCWTLAVGEMKLLYAIGGSNPVDPAVGELWMAGHAPPDRFYEQRSLVDGGDVTIDGVTFDYVCFTTPGEGRQAFDLRTGELLPPGPVEGCAEP